jgi:hypothetical protein
MAVKQVYLLEGGYMYVDRSILLWGRGYGQEQKNSSMHGSSGNRQGLGAH